MLQYIKIASYAKDFFLCALDTYEKMYIIYIKELY